MRVLIACEYSGAVRDAFIARGHDAMSCDLMETDVPGPHYCGDVFDVVNDGWDLMIAHPPCTHLAVSGARHFYRKSTQQIEALDFVKRLASVDIPRICIENPVSIISTRLGKPTQIIQPYHFGDSFQKTTCLWLFWLPRLKATNIVDRGEIYTAPSGKRMPKWFAENKSAKVRSKTFPGIAAAMADQWGSLPVLRAA